MELFEFLRKKGLSPGHTQKALRLFSRSEVISVFEWISELLPQPHRAGDRTFEFAANGWMSGQRYPCASPICRLEAIDRTARFGALYADQVILKAPFEAGLIEHYADEAELKAEAHF